MAEDHDEFGGEVLHRRGSAGSRIRTGLEGCGGEARGQGRGGGLRSGLREGRSAGSDAPLVPLLPCLTNRTLVGHFLRRIV
jgi:hypothetical protein